MKVEPLYIALAEPLGTSVFIAEKLPRGLKYLRKPELVEEACPSGHLHNSCSS